MKKPLKIFFGVFGVLALVGIAFACLSIYAKKEINKPKFQLPEIAEVQALTPLPSSKEEAFEYVNALFKDCVSADDIELSEHNSVSLTGSESETPFNGADASVFSRVLEQVGGKIGELYPVTENEPITKLKTVPSLGFTGADVTDFTAEIGYTTEEGETEDDGYYYITLTLKPEAMNTAAMLKSDISKKVVKELEPMLSVSDAELFPEEFTASFKIRYSTDSLEHVELCKKLSVKSTVEFTDDYKALSEKEVKLTVPFEKTQSIDLFRYGLHFYERQTALQTGDTMALPLDVRVNSEASKENYKLSFNTSQEGILSIDADGVMEAVEASEKPVTVTAVLEYNGHTYTDSIAVYATNLEVKTDES